jgi:hypothetical protein
MKERIIVCAVTVTGVVVLVFALLHLISPTGPVYKGKPVSAWVSVCVLKPGNSFSELEPEVLAVRNIGSDAVPYLVKATRMKPGFLGSKFYMALYRRLPARLSQRLPLPLDNKNIRFRAYASLAALGSAAKPAVPFLAEEFKNHRNVDSVRFVLVAIGPDAAEAIPVLTNAFHGTNQVFRWMAARTLAKVNPTNPELLPTMLAELRSTNVIARRGACLVLGGLGPAAKSTIPALTQALQDGDKGVRDNADRAFRAISLSSNAPPAHLF